MHIILVLVQNVHYITQQRFFREVWLADNEFIIHSVVAGLSQVCTILR